MASIKRISVLRWTAVVPVVAVIVLALSWGSHLATPLVIVIGAVLIGAVLAAVHHAEVVAHRVGEPFGSLVLAVAVTVIEVALIVTLMVSGGKDTATLARDTVFAAVMITCNGIIGRAAELHRVATRAGVLAGPARVRRGRVARALRVVRLRADGAPP